jgi:uncharacterized protein YkwD
MKHLIRIITMAVAALLLTACMDAKELGVLSEMNKARNLDYLIYNDGLQQYAEAHNARLVEADRMFHSDMSVLGPYAARACGCWMAGEILGHVQANEWDDLVAAWTASPGHAAVLYGRQYEPVGISVLPDRNTAGMVYVTAILGAR